MVMPDITFYSSIANVIDIVLENWTIAAVGLVVFATLLVGVFKGFKPLYRLLKLYLFIGIIALVGVLIFYFAQKDLQGLIFFAIKWLPTILFFLMLVIALLIGIHRGFRKSLILFIQSLVCMAICLGMFLFFTTSPVADGWIVTVANMIMGENGIQDMFGVSTDCTTMREVLLEFITAFLSDGGDIGLLISENSAYIITLINMAYHIVFAVLFTIIYYILVFILYLIYLIFYPERRYKKKKNIKFAQNRTDMSYKKRPIGGGCIGLIRGTISGLVSLSFLGSILFIAAGGLGGANLPEVDFGSNEVNFGYNIYRSVESYGDHGIYKLLNSMQDLNDTPYYLFAADLVMSGGLDDDIHDVKGNIKFREEIGAFTGFAKDTLLLLLKYGQDDVQAIINGEGDDDAMSTVLEVMTNPGFRAEFEILIDDFDSKTYIINLGLSLVDSMIAHIDDVSFMSSVSDGGKDLLKLLFKRGYLCDAIPDERDKKAAGIELTPEDTPPCLMVNHLLTKQDVQVAVRVALSILAGEIDTEDTLSIIKVLLPEIEQLSLFSDGRSKEIDPVLGRLYCYLENTYLTEEGEDGITYAAVAQENIRWTHEIRSLLGATDSILTFYDKLSESEDILTDIADMFDRDNAEYAENVKLYDDIAGAVADSALVGKVLASGVVASTLKEQLEGVGDVYIPRRVVYENKYDEDGKLLSRGEAYYILYGLRFLVDGNNRKILDAFTSEDADTENLLDDISSVINNRDSQGNKLSDYLTESVLLRSIISTVILEQAGDVIAVPKLSLEKDEGGSIVNLVNKPELKQIFDALGDLLELLKPLTGGDYTSDDIKALVDSRVFTSLIDSGNKIIEGTIANALIELFADNDQLIIPQALQDFEGWVTVGTPGELRKMLRAVQILSLDIAAMIDSGIDGEDIFDKLQAISEADISEMLDSQVVHYTVSDVLVGGEFGFDGFSVVIPDSSCTQLIDDTIASIIKKDELVTVFFELKDLGLSSDLGSNDIVKKLVQKKQVLTRSDIISASVVSFVVANDDICSSLNIPVKFLKDGDGSAAALKQYRATNAWRKELPALITAIDEIFNISGGEELSFDSDTVSEKTNELLKNLNKSAITDASRTKLDVCFDSEILQNDITVELDKALDGVVKQDVIDASKVNGYYSEREIKALSDTATLFDLDYLNMGGGDGITEKVKGEILKLNDPRPDYNNSTALEICYNSVIIRHVMTEQLDKSLNGENGTDETLIDIAVRDGFKQSGVYPQSEFAALVRVLDIVGVTDIDNIGTNLFTDMASYRNKIDDIYSSGIAAGIVTKQIDEALTENIIDGRVKTQIKGGSTIYSQAGIHALFNALDELQLTNFADFEKFNFSDQKDTFLRPAVTDGSKQRIDILYKSDIVDGIITKSVRDTIDNNAALEFSRNALRSDIDVLKEIEIRSLLEVLGELNLDSCDIGAISINTIEKLLTPDANNAPKSYIILASFSANLISNSAIYIPSTLYSDGHISPQEAVNFIRALNAFIGNDAVNNWTVENDMVLPDKAHRADIFNSRIMCATFSRQVFALNSNIAISVNNIEIETRAVASGTPNERIAIISEAQLTALFDLLDVLYSGDSGKKELSIPTFDSVESLATIGSNIDLFYNLDVTRYSISELITSIPLIGSMYTTTTEACYTVNWPTDGAIRPRETSVEVMSLEDIKSFIGNL